MQKEVIELIIYIAMLSACIISYILIFKMINSKSEEKKEFKIGCNANFDTSGCNKNDCLNCQFFGVKSIKNEK